MIDITDAIESQEMLFKRLSQRINTFYCWQCQLGIIYIMKIRNEFDANGGFYWALSKLIEDFVRANFSSLAINELIIGDAEAHKISFIWNEIFAPKDGCNIYASNNFCSMK